MTPEVLWCTSLPPADDAAAQARRVASWGGRVASFHDAEEAAGLAAPPSGVARVTVSRSGRKAVGKPVPFLTDILEWQTCEKAAVCGIVNADIGFEATVAERAWLVETARTALVCIRRTDVENASAPLETGTQLPQGYDAFLYPASLAPALRAEGFCLGMPFWDFWLPVAAMLSGHPVVSVVAPIARHVAHPTRWDDSARVFMHVFQQAVLDAATRTVPTLHAAVLSSGFAAYRGLFDLAARSVDAAGLLNAVYDDFQSRVLAALAAASRRVEAIPGGPPRADDEFPPKAPRS